MKTNIEKLIKVVEAAMPGSWSIATLPGGAQRLVDAHDDPVLVHNNMDFVATFDPPTVSAILTELKKARETVERQAREIEILKVWENFASHLVDHCEGTIITEEGLQGELVTVCKKIGYKWPPEETNDQD